MSKRLLLLAASTLGLAACAADPIAPPSGPSAPISSSTGAVPLTPAFTPALNIAASSGWSSEERLLPQQPILALIADGGSVNSPVGASMTCNPDNGQITARIGRQDATRVGKEATYKLRIGTASDDLSGKFELNRQQQVDFVFQLRSNKIEQISKASEVVIESDTGEGQWAFVKDPAATPRAKYVASLKNFAAEAGEFLIYCNPK